MGTIHTFFKLQSTCLGKVGLIWSFDHDIPKANRIILSRPEIQVDQIMAEQYAHLTPSSCAEVDTISMQIVAFMEGESITFDLTSARLDLCPLFQQRVLQAECRVPRGWVTTYQRIAKHLGNPNAARAVGHALATNPFPIVIPCHRAIRSDRTLGGFQGGLDMKHILLEQEGHAFDPGMRIRNPRLYY